MNHEFNKPVDSQPVIGGPVYRGAFISRYIHAPDGSVLSGERAYDTVFDHFAGTSFPAADSTNSSRAFSRFCSASIAGPDGGYDRPIYLAGEESSGADTFDGRGGTLTATFDNQIHTLKKFPRIPWENALPRPFGGNEVVVMSMEDGPASPDSQLYMYVGKKDRSSRHERAQPQRPRQRQGLRLSLKGPSRNNENTFLSGSIIGEWVEIPNVENLTDAQLEVEADARNAFGFVRTEDGAWSKTSRKDYYFCTTGDASQPGNKLGRLYHLELNPGNPLKDAKLTVLVNADQVIAAGGDTVLSADNMDVNGEYLMVQEDGTERDAADHGAKEPRRQHLAFPAREHQRRDR